MLNPGDDREVAHREDRAEQESDVRDGLRVLCRVEVVQISEVPVGVDIEQGGPVRDLGDDTQREADSQNHQKDPVSPRADAKALTARGAEPAFAPVACLFTERRMGGVHGDISAPAARTAAKSVRPQGLEP